MSSQLTEIEICNLALSWLGEDVITSFEDNNLKARLCKTNYGPSRDAVLESREWTFAVKRYTINKDATAPKYGFSARFKIPTEVLRVLTVDREEITGSNELTHGFVEAEQQNWVREGDYILANVDTITLRGIYRVTGTTEWSPSFVQALAARLAADLAIPITRSKTLQQQMFALYDAKLADAAASDGLQGRSKRIRSRYLTARR